MGKYKPKLHSYVVKWTIPKEESLMYNTYGTYKGNQVWVLMDFSWETVMGTQCLLRIKELV